ncbi:MAG: histidine phosphatase family protein [Chloroflexota bacterium]
MIVYIIRHAQSQNNVVATMAKDHAEFVANYVTDPSITKLGFEQADLVAEHLKSETDIDRLADTPESKLWGGYNITHLYCSPMLRTMQTALPIGWALALQPEIWVDIHENNGLYRYNSADPEDISSYSGLTRSQMIERFPGYKLVDQITEEGWWFGGREEFSLCMGRALRVSDTLRKWAAKQHQEGRAETIALVSHGTFIDCLLKALTYRLPDTSVHYHNYNTAINRVDFHEDGKVTLRYINRTQHLPPGTISQ